MSKVKDPIAVWDFTLAERTCNVGELKEFLNKHCKRWAFQLEEGEQNGYKHYQGRVSLKVRARKGPCHDAIHWSPTSKDVAVTGNEFYVLKEETRVLGPWTDRDPYIPRQVRGIELWKRAPRS